MGQLGIVGTGDKNEPYAVDTSVALNLKQIKSISAGEKHVLALDANGISYSWGNNAEGQLGANNAALPSNQNPALVYDGDFVTGQKLIMVSGGLKHSLALNNLGRVFAWGRNLEGQLGLPQTTTSAIKPTDISTPSVLNTFRIIQVSAGYYHSLFLTEGGAVYATGGNSCGCVGDGTATARFAPQVVPASAPTDVLNGKFIAKVLAGYDYSIALDADGNMYCL